MSPSTPCSLYWRKGIDLLSELIPIVCAAHPTVRFLIGGDGPKKGVLDRMCSQHKVGQDGLKAIVAATCKFFFGEEKRGLWTCR